MEMIGNAEGLLRAVLEQARGESDAVASAAEAGAGEIVARAAEAARREGSDRLEAATAEAARSRALLLAAVPAEAARFRLARIEALLDSIKAGALRRLAEENNCAAAVAALAGLAAQAAASMEGSSFILTLAPAQAALLRGRTGEIERLAGKGGLHLVFEEDPSVNGGVKARDAAGRQFWDNTPRARLERLWPELRSGLAESLAGEKK